MLPNRLAALRRRSDENLIAFLRTELDLGLTLAGVAITRRDMGSENWEQSAEHAENAYSEVGRYLTDPKLAGRLPDEQRREFEAGMKRLRKALDDLPRSDQQGGEIASDGEALASNRQPSD